MALMDFETIYRTYKHLLFSVGYRMLGSVSDAEDMVQDLFTSLKTLDTDNINNLKSYLVKMMTNRCLNYLNSASKQREIYVGAWLPEPLIMVNNHDPMGQVVQDETISYAFLVLLQELSSVERAVFVLREVLGYEYGEVAEMLNKTEINCRKIYSRAKVKVNQGKERNLGELGESEPLVKKFLYAVHTGNFKDFVSLLTDDAVLISDGGGKRRAALKTIFGKQRILAFFAGIAAKGSLQGKWLPILINGQTGLVLVKDQIADIVICFDMDANQLQANQVFQILNPDKLQHISSVLDCHKSPDLFVL
ncbi:RNA polymerase sigma-70 factor [Paenibacillus sp. Soil787]|uniref:RNA polymerase sigma-70 factor n=1 Tax=Paenibacillus sp. Soil787 TaxID=1736411 RepID=UPI000A668156|nr:RNA polymerase sigma-70 factor [Paenibacillus sp. Soil787]